MSITSIPNAIEEKLVKKVLAEQLNKQVGWPITVSPVDKTKLFEKPAAKPKPNAPGSYGLKREGGMTLKMLARRVGTEIVGERLMAEPFKLRSSDLSREQFGRIAYAFARRLNSFVSYNVWFIVKDALYFHSGTEQIDEAPRFVGPNRLKAFTEDLLDGTDDESGLRSYFADQKINGKIVSLTIDAKTRTAIGKCKFNYEIRNVLLKSSVKSYIKKVN